MVDTEPQRVRNTTYIHLVNQETASQQIYFYLNHCFIDFEYKNVAYSINKTVVNKYLIPYTSVSIIKRLWSVSYLLHGIRK